MICYACGKGKLTQSGCHSYCDACSYTAFVMTPDYVSSCAALIGTLVSNTEFKENEGFVETVQDMIETHLPILHTTMTQHIDRRALPKFFKAFIDEVRIHSINLVAPVNVDLFKVEDQQHSVAVPAGVQVKCEVCGAINSIEEVDRLLHACSECRSGYRKVDGGYQLL